MVPGTAPKADERRKDSCLDAENPMTPRILLVVVLAASRLAITVEVAGRARGYKCGDLYQRSLTMRGVALATLLSSAAAFLGGSPALKVRHAKSSPQIAAQAPLARSVALQMSSALAEESGVSLSSGGGMFTSSSPEDRRIGTELCVVRRLIYRARAHTRLARGDRAASAARAHRCQNLLPVFRRLAGARERSPIQRNVIERAPHTCTHVIV